jgi:hypothetical protein
MMPGRQGGAAAVPGTEGFLILLEPIRQDFFDLCRVHGLPANGAADQIRRDDLFPLPLQKLLEFNRTLRTDAPAMTAPRAEEGIVQEGSQTALVLIAQCLGRAALYAGQAPGAFLVDLKIGHVLSKVLNRQDAKCAKKRFVFFTCRAAGR